MSLRAFHIIFVAITTLLCVFLAVWGFLLAPSTLVDSARKIAYGGIAGAIVMPLYGVYFYNKITKIDHKL